MSSLADSIELFLRDLFAFLFPGAVFLGALRLAIGPEWATVLEGRVELPPNSTADWFVAGMGAYIVGYILQAFGDEVVVPIVDRLTHRLPKRARGNLQAKKKLYASINQSQTYAALIPQLSQASGASVAVMPVRETRNLAMSVPGVRLTEVYRNMYTSQLCLGSAAALLVAAVGVLATWLAARTDVLEATVPNESFAWSVGFILAAGALLDRRYRYYSISMRLPFALALAALRGGVATQETEQ